MEKELGHPTLAFTMGRVFPEADCPLTVGLCERPLHSLSYYTASLTRRHRKEPGCMWVMQRGWMGGGGRNYYSMTHIKALDGVLTSTAVEYVVMGMNRCAVIGREF